MFPAAAAKAEMAEKKDAEKKEPQFEKVKGTAIQFLKGGEAVRICATTGKQFPPNAIEEAKKYIEEVGSKYSKKKGKKGPAEKKEKKELTPEQIEENEKKAA